MNKDVNMNIYPYFSLYLMVGNEEVVKPERSWGWSWTKCITVTNDPSLLILWPLAKILYTFDATTQLCTIKTRLLFCTFVFIIPILNQKALQQPTQDIHCCLKLKKAWGNPTAIMTVSILTSCLCEIKGNFSMCSITPFSSPATQSMVMNQLNCGQAPVQK